MSSINLGQPVEIPVSKGRALRMFDCEGRDQIVRACVAGGWDAFESPMPQVFHACVNATKGAVVDIGANTGFYTLLAAVARTDAVLWSFEPDPQVRPILEENLQLNGLAERVAVFSQALSSRSGVASLYLPTREHGCIETSSSLEQSFKESHAEVLPVEVITLDAHVAASPAGQIGLVKIDVEGHEALVLAGARATVESHRPLVFIEVLPRADLAALQGFLRHHSYLEITLHASGPGQPKPTIESDEMAWNHLLVPAEQAGVIVSRLDRTATRPRN